MRISDWSSDVCSSDLPAGSGPEAIPAGAVTAPMVGTVYVASEPGAPPFVKAGDEVHEGQVLLIIEAMKVMNPLAAPRAGTVKQILVTDGQPVEYGEPLLVIEKAARQRCSTRSSLPTAARSRSASDRKSTR